MPIVWLYVRQSPIVIEMSSYPSSTCNIFPYTCVYLCLVSRMTLPRVRGCFCRWRQNGKSCPIEQRKFYKPYTKVMWQRCIECKKVTMGFPSLHNAKESVDMPYLMVTCRMAGMPHIMTCHARTMPCWRYMSHCDGFTCDVDLGYLNINSREFVITCRVSDYHVSCQLVD